MLVGGVTISTASPLYFNGLNLLLHLQARALVLVGGTMQPTGDLVRQLFSSVDPSRVEVFSCGHVIPKENLLPLCMSR